MGKPKKGKKTQQDEESDDDISSQVASLTLDNESIESAKTVNGESLEEKPTKTKKDKKKKSKVVLEYENDDDDSAEEMAPSRVSGRKPKGGFSMLELLGDEADLGSDSDNDAVISEEEKPQPVKKVSEAQVESKQKKKKDKKKKPKEENDAEDDLDAILAELEKPKEKTTKKKGKKEVKEEFVDDAENVISNAITKSSTVTMDDVEEEAEDEGKKKKKRKKKDKKKQEEDVEENIQVEEVDKGEGEEGEDEEEHTVKTAAQKKKDKKEREKTKRAEGKLKQKESSVEKEDTVATGAEVTDKSPEQDEGNQGEGEEETGKKKKKKKGEKTKEEKKPNKRLAAIKERLLKLKEEEERAKIEQEEKQRRDEEDERKRIEQLRLEKERKELKKQREKEKKERLKAEGKWLTDKQKKDRVRALQMLDVMRAQGLDIPDRDSVQPRKRPVYSTKKRQKPVSKEGEEEKSPSPTEELELMTPDDIDKESSPGSEADKSEEPTTPGVEVGEEDATPGEVKDAWDEESDDEKEAEMMIAETSTSKEASALKTTKKAEVKVESEEESDESEDEDEDDDEEEEEDDSEDSSEEESESESDEADDDLTPMERAKLKIQKQRDDAEKKRTVDELRAAVVVVLGHVDTGKTTLLDKLRRTHVQDSEAGGITQQIGATNVPRDVIRERTTMCKEFQKDELRLPGLLIIDTPGHESFKNLRSRGSSLCDIAILVVDIMHGLEPQTIESINLLKHRNMPFIVALNKIDSLYQWQTNPQNNIVNTLKKQQQITKQEFDERVKKVILEFAEQGLNAILFHENKDPEDYISLVPTSARSGDGMGNLIALVCEMAQTRLAERLMYSEMLQATVMEVKALPGLGTTIDVILVNGQLNETDTIIVAGTEGPIVTTIRGLLMPQPMKELRVKNHYEHFKILKAAQGVKLIAKELEKSLAGLPLYVAKNHDPDEIEYYKSDLAGQLQSLLNSIKLQERGVFVHASTLGSLEALLEFLRSEKIPFASIGIGPIHRKDVMKASVMLEHDPQYAVILAFDVRVERDAQDMADSLGVRVFTADIIYHLFDKFMSYRDELKKSKQEQYKHIAVFPCKLRILPDYIFNSRDPIVMGVIVEGGFVKIGTPICVPSKENLLIGQVTSIEFNHKVMEKARKGQEVCVKIEGSPGDTPKMYGRHFDHTDALVSKITRESIDVVKDWFRDEMQRSDWILVQELKKTFEIM